VERKKSNDNICHLHALAHYVHDVATFYLTPQEVIDSDMEVSQMIEKRQRRRFTKEFKIEP